jgi:MFS family permease
MGVGVGAGVGAGGRVVVDARPRPRPSSSSCALRAVYNASWDGIEDTPNSDEGLFRDFGADEDEARMKVSALGYAGALLLNVALGTLFCWSFYLIPLEAHLGVGRAMLSSVFSLSTIATVCAMSFAGPVVYATWAPTRLAVGSALLAACGLWTASFAVPLRAVWPLFLGYGLMFGFASGLGYGLSVQMSSYAPLKSGLATGLVTSARAFGAFIFAPLVKQAIISHGPQFAIHQLGTYIAASAVPIFLLFNGSGLKLPLAKRRSTSSVTLEEMERDIKLKPLVRLLWLCMATGLFSGLMVMSHGATLLSSRGIAAQMLVIGGISIVSAMTTIGRILGGWLCDRVPPKRVLVLTPLLAVGPLIWAAMDKTSIIAGELSLAAAALVYGMFASTIPVEVRRVAGAGDFARTYGRIFTAWGLAGLAAPYLAGVFYDRYGVTSAVLAQLLESPRQAAREQLANEMSRAETAARLGERFIDCTKTSEND